jgi:hypothetical protein
MYNFFNNFAKKTVEYYPLLNMGISAVRYSFFSPFSSLPSNTLSNTFQITQALLLSSVEGGMSYLGATITSNEIKKIFGERSPKTTLPISEKEGDQGVATHIKYKQFLKLYIALLYCISIFIYKNQADSAALKMLGVESDLASNMVYLINMMGIYSDFGLGYFGAEAFTTYLSKFGFKYFNESQGVRVKREGVIDDQDESVEVTIKQKTS